MGKYKALSDFLRSLEGEEWTARFREIESILGFSLPQSAYQYPAWWANQTGDGHSQCSSWQSVGWRTEELDLAGRKVSFVKERTLISPESRAMVASDQTAQVLNISDAKAALAAKLGILPENIEITIKI